MDLLDPLHFFHHRTCNGVRTIFLKHIQLFICLLGYEPDLISLRYLATVALLHPIFPAMSFTVISGFSLNKT